MLQTILHRCVAFGLSAAITLAMLGGIDHLAVPDNGASGWAQQSQPQTPRA